MANVNELLSIQISAIREIYQYIDGKINSFVDAESRLNDALEQKKRLENKYSGKSLCFMLLLLVLC